MTNICKIIKFIIFTTCMGFKWLEKDLNRALKAAGNQDRYQYIVVSLLCVIFFLNIFLVAGSSIYYMDPVFSCGDSDLVYEQDYACSRLYECKVINNFTIVFKMQLYCDQQYKRSLIQSSLAVGSLLGLIIMNALSDLKGRKFALIIDLFLATLSALFTYLGALAQSTVILVFSSILNGFSGYSLMIISYIMLGDICEESLRQKSSVYINMSMSIGMCMFFVLFKWLNFWEDIVILFMLLPLGGITLLCYFFLEQSPNYFIFQKRNVEECTKSLMNIAKINSKTYSDAQKIKYYIKKVQKKLFSDLVVNVQPNILRSLSKWKYLKIIICMAFVQSGGNLCFYGVQYAINNIGYSFGINSLVIGVSQILTTLFVGQYVTKLERKKTLGIVFGLTPVITLLFASDFVGSSQFLSTFFIGVMRILTTIGYFMIVMIETQSFPLQIQSLGAGSIQAFAQLGSFIAPILNAFSINHGFSKISTMGVAMFVFLLPLYFVPESSSIVFRKQPKLLDSQTRKIQSQKYI